MRQQQSRIDVVAQNIQTQNSPMPKLNIVKHHDFQSPIEIVSQSCYRNLKNSAFNEGESLNIPHGSFSSSRSNQSSNSSSNQHSSQEQHIVKYTKRFKNIVERDNEDSDYDCQQSCNQQSQQEYQDQQGKGQRYEINQNSYSPENIDILGNLLPICEFDVEQKNSSSRDDQESYFTQLPQIVEDKENQAPAKYGSNIKSNVNMSLYTPLKNKNEALRSPLRDITPSVTKTKKKSAAQNKTNATQRSYLFTPRNQSLTQSRISGSGMRRMERF